MGQSKSDLAPVSNTKEPQLGSDVEPSSPGDHSPPSDLNHAAEDDALGDELENKLALKDEVEGVPQNEEKVSNFTDGEQVCDEESGKGEEVYGDNTGWDTNSWDENVNEEVYGGGDGNGNGNGNGDGYGYGYGDGDGGGVEKKEEDNNSGTHYYPLRPDAEDCSFYIKTGNCKFGSNCKFNHPIRRKNQRFTVKWCHNCSRGDIKTLDIVAQIVAVKEKAKEREESAERSGQTECKYYQRSGGCKFGKACKYNHTRVSTAAPTVELNFLGLPIRLGGRECPYYMRTGSCKFGASCKFNHPDPTTVGGCDPQSGYGNGGSFPLQSLSQPSVPSWSSPRTLNETSFVPMMMTPTQGVTPQSSDWNGYQAPIYSTERSSRPSSTSVVNKPTIETNVYMHHQNHMQAEEFPERPGEPECSFFIKTGDCKFKSNCKFHHPKNRGATSPPCNLSDKGLPLRPDQSVCSHYSRYGICKFGPACKFNHPINSLPIMMPGLGQQSYTNSANVEIDGIGKSTGASDTTIQQSA